MSEEKSILAVVYETPEAAAMEAKADGLTGDTVVHICFSKSYERCLTGELITWRPFDFYASTFEKAIDYVRYGREPGEKVIIEEVQVATEDCE